MVKLKKGTPRSGFTIKPWDTQYAIGYAIDSEDNFTFYPARWIGPADKPDFTLSGTTSAKKLLETIVSNGLGLCTYSYTIVGEKRSTTPLSNEEVKLVLLEAADLTVRLGTKWANGAAKAHFVFEPKKAPAKKAPAKKAPAKRTLKGL